MQRNGFRHAFRLILAVVAGFATALVLFQGTATAQSGSAAATESTVAPQYAPLSAQTDLEAYWTDERLASARPAEAPAGKVTPERTPPAKAQPRTVPPTAPEGSGIQPMLDHSYATGKMFYTMNGTNWQCSASALSSTNQSLVLTAGHCLHAGNNAESGWATNVVFVPGYDNGNRPRGTWTGIYSSQRVFSSWYSSGSYNRDLGMFRVNPNAGGQRLTQVVGGHGLQTGQGYGHQLHMIGYPSNRDGGQVQWHCWGATSRVSSSDNRIQMNCNFAQGASGGPWLRNYSANYPGLGIANGATSTITSSGLNRSSYFDNSTWDFYVLMRA